MFQLLVVYTAIACVFVFPHKSASVPFLDSKIVGGEPVDIEDHPYQISLLYYRSHRCGGSIISSRYVVTAAHCTFGVIAIELSVRADSSIRNDPEGGTVIDVETIHQHPLFDDETLNNDISILKLSEGLLFGAGISPISLPVQDEEIIAGTSAVVTGWGRLTEGGILPLQLQAVEVPVITIEECRDAYGAENITETMMCAGFPEGGKDACNGDSGGPLVIGGQLIGIVSWGEGCAQPNFPGVYASVPALRYYITSISGI